MATSNASVIMAVFDERGRAEMAIDQLMHEGFSQDEVGIVMPGGAVKQASTATEQSEERAAAAEAARAVTGGGAGAVASDRPGKSPSHDRADRRTPPVGPARPQSRLRLAAGRARHKPPLPRRAAHNGVPGAARRPRTDREWKRAGRPRVLQNDP